MLLFAVAIYILVEACQRLRQPTEIKSTTMLAPAGDKLEAKGTFKAGVGTKVVAMVTLPGKAPTSVRFALK